MLGIESLYYRPRLIHVGVTSIAALVLSGCEVANMPMLNPVGDVTTAEYELLKISTFVMSVIGLPIILATLWVVWRYRASANNEDFETKFDHSSLINKVTFFVPLLTIFALGTLTWVYTHRLDPYRPRNDGSNLPPYEIQAVSLDYKWLFIYPDKSVAIVNELVAPIGRAVTIRVTSDPMMTSIFIPSLISQIYAMTGMETRANFMAPTPAVLDGANAMYSGPQFEKQRFKVRLVPMAQFQSWLQLVAGGAPIVSQGGDIKSEPLLDFARYRKLAERTPGYPITAFNKVEPGLFQRIVQQYEPRYRMNPLPMAPQKSANNSNATTTSSHSRH